jgi:hypothetical protein
VKPLIHAIQRFVQLPANERGVVIRAVVGLPLMAAALRIWPYARVRAAIAPSGVSAKEPPERSRQIGRLVSSVARRHPYRANCLEQSLALWWILGRNGIEAAIRFGVRPPATGGNPDFHAWVEANGEVLNDRPDIAVEFLPFDREIPPRRERFV